MSEFIFGPSAEWLVSTQEWVQPRLDGGYDYPRFKKLSAFVCENVVQRPIYNPNQPTLFDDLEDVIEFSDNYYQPTLFDEETK